MQKTNDRKEEKSTASGAIGELIRSGIEKRKASPIALIQDLLVFVCALIFARASLVFDTRPLALALVAILPSHTWIALLGAVLGSLSLGVSGVIYAMICAIVVFLRVIISGGESKDTKESGTTDISFTGEKGEENDVGNNANDTRVSGKKLAQALNFSLLTGQKQRSGLFKENVLLRVCSAVIGGFICAVYEVLLTGFELKSILFGIGMIILPALVSLLLSGLFECGITFKEILGEGKAVFASAAPERKTPLIFFRISALVLVLCVSLSLDEYGLLGISAAYVFATIITLFCAKRFGALAAGAVGFASTIGISSLYTLGFTLSGIAAGALFALNHVYALLGGGLALFAFCAYAGGVLGITATLPEYIIGALVSYPITRGMNMERGTGESEKCEKSATDMVGTMALFYKSSARRALGKIPSALRELSSQIDAFMSAKPKISDYEAVVYQEIKEYAPLVEKDENTLKIATKVYKKAKLSEEDFRFYDFTREEIAELTEKIEKASAALMKLTYKGAQDLSILSTIIGEVSFSEEAELCMNEALTDKLDEAVASRGFCDGVIRAFGNRQKHLILAGRDDDGTLITSPLLKEGLETATGAALGSYEYFRKGKMVLLECDAVPKYKVEYASATAPGSSGESSGDRTTSFTTENGFFYSLVLDGMGSGEVAGAAAEFSSGVLSTLLNLNSAPEGAFHLLNSLLRHGSEECSVSVDLFKLDLLNKEAVFVKSGAAPSYVKRGSSIFRVRSATAPLGLMSSIDSEKIKVQVEPGDFVIMLSDGISQSPEDAPWLLELLSSRTQRTPKEYAELILKEAKSRVRRYDDMTVAVMKVSECNR